MHWYRHLIAAAGAALVVSAATGPAAAATEITLWSHWADHETKVAFVEEAAKRFEAKNPDYTVKISWYQKNPLYAALKASLQARQGPDIFYCESDQTEYIDNGFLFALDDHVDWDNVEPWARRVWTFGGKTYAMPLEAFTVETYYNTELMKQMGVELPENGQLDGASFRNLVEKSAAAGVTPIVQGIGDRPFPGAYVLHEMILKQIGVEDYGKLMNGQLSFTDPRVVGAFEYVKSLVDAEAYPKSFSTLKLGESHYHFHTKPGGLMFPMGSWYTSRAFNPPDKGGQPEDFPLGIMNLPALADAACPNCKTSGIGGSFCVNADSPHAAKAAGVLAAMADPEMGNLWLTSVLVQTGVKSDPEKITGQYRPYFQSLMAINGRDEFFIGIPQAHMKGQCLETFKQVMNGAFPAGQIGVQQAVTMMDGACFKG